MSDKGFKEVEGNCVISEEVIATITCTAAKEVPGVAALAQRPNDIRGIITSSPTRSVKIVNTDSELIVTVYIIVKLGEQIQEVAAEVQKAVKAAIHSMAGKPLTRVDVNIAGVESEPKD